MTDPLKNIIEKNRDAFNTEPVEGHFERFKRKLEAGPVRHKGFKGRYYLEIAAVVLIVLLAGNQVRMYFSNQNKTREETGPLTLSSVSPEYREVEYYYISAIDQGMSHWTNLRNQGLVSPEEQKTTEMEMKEFDETYARLQKELEASPEDERVIHAMLEVYEAKLSIITMIINKLETIKQQKKTSNETKI